MSLAAMRSRAQWLRPAAAAALLLAGSASSVGAGWWEVRQADANLELADARRLALAAVAEDPLSANAIAAAFWWLQTLDHLADPAEVLTVAAEPRDPELEFLLARIEAELTGRIPAGSLSPAELSGPYGVFDTLDLERDVVPGDGDLLPQGTPWTRPWRPYRVQLETSDGLVSIPSSLDAGGVALVAWTVEPKAVVDGWMVVECRGSLDLELDGRRLARLRYCGQDDPEVSWFRVRLEPGTHRIRAALASRPSSAVRVSLFDDAGRPITLPAAADRPGPSAASTASPALPPASATVAVGSATSLEELLLAAELARARGDSLRERAHLERARVAAPDSPWPRLALASFYLTSPTGVDAETDARRAREELRHCGGIPAALMVERTLALRETRAEDYERVLDQLVDAHGDDPRVRQLWVREALRRGWAGEVEEGIEALRSELPESPGVLELRLDALETLDLWEERQELLRTVAAADPVRLKWVEELASGCLAGDAVAVLDRLRDRVEDPTLDISRIRLLLTADELAQARQEVETARLRWGDLHALDQLAMVVEAEDPEALDRALAAAIDRDPSDLQLRTLAWRLGTPPFFEPFRIDAAEVLERDAAAGELDVVLLLDQAVERVYPDGSAIYYYHGISRAITPVGARQASVLQQMPDAYLLTLRIHKPDGRIVVPSQVESRNGTLVLGEVSPGDVVEEEYVASVLPTGSSRRGHMSPYVYRFADENRAFGHSEYLLLVPPDVDLKVDGNFDGLEREEWDHQGLRAIRWLNQDVPPLRAEPFSPPVQELLPWVSYSFGVTWQDVGDTMRDRLLLVLRTSPELRAWSEPLLAGEDTVAVVRRLVEAVADEVAPGRRELTLTATAGVSFARREENRLGIVAAALMDAGWEVDVVMARPRPLAGVHLEVPTLETFSEPLLRVRRSGREIWIDLQGQRRDVDRIRPILQGGDGLVLPLTRPAESVTLLDRLPTFANPELEQRMRVTAMLQDSGDARIAFEMDLEGPEAEELVDRVRATPDDRVQLVYQQMANNLFPGAGDVAGVIDRDPERTVLRLDLTLRDACDVEGDRMVCRGLVVSRPLVPALATLPERQYPLVVQLPITERVELGLDAPPGWSVDRPERRLETQWGSVEERLEVAGERIRSVLTLQVPARTVTPEEYPQFARFCQAVDELSSRPPTLVRD